jgi:magnesium chelatase family protein
VSDLEEFEVIEASFVCFESSSKSFHLSPNRMRFRGLKIYCNAQMTNRHIKKFCQIDEASQKLLEMAIDKFGLSARAYTRILKVARTIADLEGQENIQPTHLSEAIQYRTLDRNLVA